MSTAPPDIEISKLSGSYDYDSATGFGLLELTGFATGYISSEGATRQKIFRQSPAAKNFTLTAKFDSSQNLVTGPTESFFEITGNLSAWFAADVTLLKGSLTESRWSTDASGKFNTPVVEFLANDLAGQFHSGYGGTAALVLSGLPLGQDFLADYFDLTSGASGDVARPVPEPATLSYLMLAAMVGFRRRKQSDRASRLAA